MLADALARRSRASGRRWATNRSTNSESELTYSQRLCETPGRSVYRGVLPAALSASLIIRQVRVLEAPGQELMRLNPVRLK